MKFKDMLRMQYPLNSEKLQILHFLEKNKCFQFPSDMKFQFYKIFYMLLLASQKAFNSV